MRFLRSLTLPARRKKNVPLRLTSPLRRIVYISSYTGTAFMDPEFLRELLPYVAKAATGCALGKSWDEIAATMGVPADMLPGLARLCPKEWHQIYNQALKLRPAPAGTSNGNSGTPEALHPEAQGRAAHPGLPAAVETTPEALHRDAAMERLRRT